MKKKLAIAALLAFATLPAAARTMQDYEVAVLRLLDKTTARVEQIELERNKPYHFGKMAVELRSCQQTPPEEEPESAAFLVVQSQRVEDKDAVWFRGWMFASNPALSALENPLYDVWVISCKKPVTTAASAPVPSSGPAVPAPSATAPATSAPIETPAKPPVPSEGLPVPVPGYVPPMAAPDKTPDGKIPPLH